MAMPNGRLQLVPFLRIAAMMAMGVWASDALPLPVWLWLALAVACLLGVFVAHRHALAQGAILLLAFFMTGACWMQVYVLRHSVALPGEAVTYHAVVVSTPVSRGQVVQCDLYVLGGPFDGQQVKASFLRPRLQLRVCDGLRVTSVLQPPADFSSSSSSSLPSSSSSSVSSHFSYKRWMQTHHFMARTLVLPQHCADTVLSLRGDSPILRLRVRALQVRAHILEQLPRWGVRGEAFSVLAAMTLGDKAALDKDTRQVYAATGAAHVLALSGMHLSVVATALMLLFFKKRRGEGRPGLRGRRAGPLGYVLLLVVVWGYVFLAGCPVSLVRAAAMLSLCSTGVLLGRDAISLNTLCLTAIILMCANPLCLWDVGFQMSFMAVLAILVFYRPLYHLLVPDVLHRLAPIRWLCGLLVVSVAAQMGVAPLTLYHFGQFSCCFLLTNVVAVPLVTVMVPMALCFFLLTLSGPVVQPLLPVVAQCLSWLATLLNTTLAHIAAWPGASLTGIPFNALMVWLVYMIEAVLFLQGMIFYRAYCCAHSMLPKDLWPV